MIDHSYFPTDKEHVFDVFLHKCQQLSSSKKLYCEFGKDSYEVLKHRQQYELYRIQKLAFAPRTTLVGSFRGLPGIRALLQLYPDMYAKDLSNGKLFYYENWTHFLESFRIKQKKRC